jgi:sugar transferase (PEP-CTERM/EpsH1 system associated)
VKILYLAHRVPYPPNKGDKIRSFHEIRHLSRRHELHLLAFCDQPEDLQYEKELKDFCRTVKLVRIDSRIQKLKAAASMLIGQPFSLGYFSDRRMRRGVQTLLAAHKFDAVFVYCSAMAPYVADLEAMPKILDFVDSDASKWAQYADAKAGIWKRLFRREAKRLMEFEIRMIDRFDHSVFVSAREGAHIPAQLRTKVSFVQNGIDLGAFQPTPRDPAQRTIIFTGAMDYFPNIDAVTFFALEVLPKVQREFADATFLIVGSRPVAAVKALGQRPGVTVTGSVPDVKPFLAAARVGVAPLRISQGIQNKVLEALAVGLPVVVSSAASAGLASMNAVPVRIADDPENIARLVCDAFNKPPLTADEIDACRRELQLHYDWTLNFSAFDRVLDSGQALLNSGKRGQASDDLRMDAETVLSDH